MASKQKFAQLVADKMGTNVNAAASAIEAVAAAVEEITISGESVRFGNLGLFKKTIRSAYVGRNPKTGEQINVPEKSKIVFKLARAKRTSINGTD